VARFIYSPGFQRYDFGDEHSLSPRRFASGLDLLRDAALLGAEDVLEPPAAGPDDLARAHAPEYVAALESLSRWAPLSEVIGMPWLEVEARRYGLDRNGEAVFSGAHDAAALVAGGSIAGLRLAVARGLHAFNPAGGLHHALAARAAGFCLYNDVAIAIAGLLEQEPQARVLYVDLDAHHDDGVEAILAHEPRVLLVSFHQFSDGFFPETGGRSLVDRKSGRLRAVNLPFPPHAGDVVWQAALEAVLPRVAEWFEPTVLVSQHGCDTHVWDPLADLHLTTRALAFQARLLHTLAHRHCAGRWLALGGGGYDVFRVVPRAWALLWAEMAGRTLPPAVPDAWLQRWAARAPALNGSLPREWLDSPAIVPALSPAEDDAIRSRVAQGTEDALDLLRGAEPPAPRPAVPAR
jgi:acetoin utilization protein AcuC